MSNSHLRKILFLAANPKNSSKLRLEEEFREIDEGLKRSEWREQFELTSQWAVRVRDIYRCMLSIQPQIVHFSGHGQGEDGIALEDEIGKLALVQADVLAGLFKVFSSKGTECVLLNACYSEKQAKLISQYIPYVVGMNKAIDDKSAITFSVAFYDALGAGEGYDFAFELGCSQLIGLKESEVPVFLSNFSEKNRVVKCSTDPKNLANITYEFVLTGSINNVSKHKLEAIVDHLKKTTGDVSLTLLEIQEGSIKLILESSAASYHLLKYLVISGELDQVLGIPVREVKRLNSETQESRENQFFSTSSYATSKEKEAVLRLVIEVENLAQSLHMTRTTNISQLKHKIQSINQNLLLLGPFNSGKSTLLNALIGNEIFPKDIYPNTFLNTLKWGNSPQYFIHSQGAKGNEDFKREVSLGEIKDITNRINLNEPNDNQQIKLEVLWPLDILESGLEITEFPGLSISDNPGNSVIQEFFSQADGVIYIMPFDVPFRNDDIVFLNNFLNSFYQKDLFIVINKKDRIYAEEREELKNSIYSIISGHLSSNGNDTPQIFFVSLLSALQGRIENNEALVKESEIDKFIQSLMAFGQHKSSIKLVAYTKVIGKILEQIFDELLMQISCLDIEINDINKNLSRATNSSDPDLLNIDLLRSRLEDMSCQKKVIMEKISTAESIQRQFYIIANNLDDLAMI